MDKNTRLFLGCTSRADLAAVFDVPLQKLTYLAYSKGRSYTKFNIKKKDGSARAIYSPETSLKSVQNTLKALLEDIYHAPSSAYGFIKDRNAIKNAEQHLRKRSVLNFDLKDFFPSIHAGRILGLFQSRPFGFNKEVASILTGLVCYENHLPQGAPTSPILSNFIAFNLDQHLIKLAKSDRLTYTRYADDITISSTSSIFPNGYFNKIGDVYVCDEKITNIVHTNGFEINGKKTRFSAKDKPHYVTGVKVNAKLNISWKFVRQVRAMLHAWATYGPDDAENHFNTKYSHGLSKNFVSVVRGKIEYIRHVKSDWDVTYRRLRNTFVELEGLGKAVLPIDEIDVLFTKIQIVKGSDGLGTGFILCNRYLITCNHTVKETSIGQDVLYFNYNEFSQTTSHKGKLVYKKSEWDIAVIDISNDSEYSKKNTFFEGYCGLDFRVETVYRAIGFPSYKTGNPPSIFPISIASWSSNVNGVKEIYVDKPLLGGMSGGVILDNRKNVCGMISRGAKDVSHAYKSHGNIFIPLHYIDKVILEYESSLLETV